MYDVLLVDDERWVVESLRKGIDWEGHGFRVAGTAADGEEALAKIRSAPPHLVFTDIRMPVVSGLELIRHSQELAHPPMFVVVSGYAEFAYAQKALQYGALGYCLKPVDPAEVNTLLDRARKILDSGEALAFSARPSTAPDQGISRLDSAVDPAGDKVARRAVVHSSAASISTLEGAGRAWANVGSGLALWILAESDYQELREAIHQQAQSGGFFVGASRTYAHQSDLDAAVNEAVSAAHGSFMNASAGIRGDREADPDALREAVRDVEHAAASRSSASIRKAFAALRSLLAGGDYTAKHAGFVYNAVAYFADVPGDMPIVQADDLLQLFHSVDEMLSFLEECVTEHAHAGEALAPAGGSAVAQKLVHYVDENFVMAVSLRELAGRFGVSSGHLCRLFKKQTGMSLTTYIATRRIDYACQLLSTTDTPVGEIAEESGYGNYFYFARVFRKLRECTPSEFRKKASGSASPPTA